MNKSLYKRFAKGLYITYTYNIYMITNKKVGTIILVTVTILVVTIVLTLVQLEVMKQFGKEIEYCKQNGWDGVIQGLNEHNCYKEIPHPSGTGTQTIKSGEI